MIRIAFFFLMVVSAMAQTMLSRSALGGKATLATYFIPDCPRSLLIPPVNCTNLMYFWTYETLPMGPISTQWNDVVVNAPLWHGGTNKLPTNTASGLRFYGGNTKLTNNIIYSSGNSCWMVLGFENPADAPVLCMSSGAGFGAVIATDSRFEMLGVPSRYLSSALPATNIVDYALVSIAGGFNLYTNGAFAGSANDYGTFTAEMFGNGVAAANGLVGNVLNYGWYTNSLDTNVVNALHQWRTNRFGGSP